MENDKKIEDPKEKNYWHEPFLYALKLELYDYKDILTFDGEYKLSEEALRIDVLVVKKTKDIEIKKNIGKSFKEYNIFEFKSETDGLYVDDYNKVLGYAFLYLSFNKVNIENVTINFVTYKMPRELFKYIKSQKFILNEREEGIYEIIGERFHTRIMVTRKLSVEENTFLKSLRSNLQIKELEATIKKYKNYEKFNDKNTFLSRIITANSKVFKEVLKHMSEAVLADLEEAFRGTILEKKWTENGVKEGEIRGEIRGEIKGKLESLKITMKILGISKVKEIGIKKLSNEYGVSELDVKKAYEELENELN